MSNMQLLTPARIPLLTFTFCMSFIFLNIFYPLPFGFLSCVCCLQFYAHSLHVDLLKEYLTANTFSSMVAFSTDPLDKQLLRLVPATTITSYYHELHGGAAGNLYSNRINIGYVYSKMDTEVLRAGTAGKTISNGCYDSLQVQQTEWEVSRFALENSREIIERYQQQQQLQQLQQAAAAQIDASPIKGSGSIFKRFQKPGALKKSLSSGEGVSPQPTPPVTPTVNDIDDKPANNSGRPRKDEYVIASLLRCH